VTKASLEVDFAGLSCYHAYRVDNTASRSISEVKQRLLWLVLGWVTATWRRLRKTDGRV